MAKETAVIQSSMTLDEAWEQVNTAHDALISGWDKVKDKPKNKNDELPIHSRSKYRSPAFISFLVVGIVCASLIFFPDSLVVNTEAVVCLSAVMTWLFFDWLAHKSVGYIRALRKIMNRDRFLHNEEEYKCRKQLHSFDSTGFRTYEWATRNALKPALDTINLNHEGEGKYRYERGEGFVLATGP